MKILIDAVLINLAFILAYFFRFRVLTSVIPIDRLPNFEDYSGTLIFITILWLAIFKLIGLYDKRSSDLIDEIALLFVSVLSASLFLLGFLFLYRGFWFSRLLI